MKLIADWRLVLKQAWSVRLMVLAALLSGAEVALPLLGDFLEPGVLAGLSALVTGATFIARILTQRNMENGT